MAAHLLEFFKKSVNRPKSLQIWSARLVMAKSVAKCCSQYFPLDVPDLSLPLCKVLMCTPLHFSRVWEKENMAKKTIFQKTQKWPLWRPLGQPNRPIGPKRVRQILFWAQTHLWCEFRQNRSRAEDSSCNRLRPSLVQSLLSSSSWAIMQFSKPTH